MLGESGDAQNEIRGANRKIKELFEKGDYKQALELATRTVDFARRYLEENHPLVEVSLTNLAVSLKWLGFLNEARQIYEQVLSLHKASREERSTAHGQTLNNLAELYVDLGDIATAESLHTQALTIFESTLPPNDPLLADSLSNLAQVYSKSNRNAEAEKLLYRALEIDQKTLGINHFVYGLHLANLASVLQNRGQHAEALRLLRQALQIVECSLGREHSLFAEMLCKMAASCRTVGDLEQAERLCREAFAIQMGSLGKTPRLALTLEMLASLYEEMHEAAQAKQALDQAQEIRRAIGQSQNQVSSLLKRADWHSLIGDLDTAESLFRQVIEIEGKSGKNDSQRASTLNNLAQVLKSKGEFQEAEQLYRRALAIESAAFRNERPARASILHNLGMLYAAMDRMAEALDFMNQAEEISEQEIGLVFSMTSERQRIEYLENVADRTSCVLSLVSEHLPDSTDAVRTAFNLVLRRKGIAAEAPALNRTAILQGGEPALNPKLREISELKGRIAEESWSGTSTQNWEEQKRRVEKLQARLEQLEMEVAQEIPETSLAQALRTVNTETVAAALVKDAVLIEYAKFHRIDFKLKPTQTRSALGPARYLVFVLPAGAPEKLRMFDLGETWPIDQAIAKYRTFLSTMGDDAGKLHTTGHAWPTGDPDLQLGEALRRMLLDPLHKAIGGSKRLFLVPTGDLTRLPFQTLPLAGDRYMVDAFNIGYFSTGRDVLRPRMAKECPPGDSVVIANPDFNLRLRNALRDSKPGVSPALKPASFLKKSIAKFFHQRASTAAGPSSANPKPGLQSSGTAATPIFQRYSSDLRKPGFYFTALPGTRVEGKLISQLLGVDPWLEAGAVKARVRGLRSPRILHMATHGFFLADQSMDVSEKPPDPRATHQITGDFIGLRQGPGMESPLLRSGLALAGANTTLEGGVLPPDAENGLLTAEEISGMDLSNTELITLSCCDSGLGELHASEGVFGLRRSCSLAGALTLVMSLWKVPDLSTAILMVKFYENLREGFGRCDALLAAQDYVRKLTIGELRNTWLTREMIDEFAAGNEAERLALERDYVRQPDALRPFTHPLFWGAFICEGYPGFLAWNEATQTEKVRLPEFAWELPQETDVRPAPEIIRRAFTAPGIHMLEPAESFVLPGRVNADIGLVISPDSRHVAYAVSDQHGMHVEVDGQPFRGYDRVFGLQLAAAGLAYGASRGKRVFAVFNQQEHDSWDDLGKSSPVISPDSRRVAYAARRGNAWYAVVDGRIVGGPYEGFAQGGILFSPDSRRYAYAVKRGSSWNAVIDGAEDSAFTAITPLSLNFSPDSAKLAYIACVRGGWESGALVGEQAVVVNGVAGPRWPVDEVTRENALIGELYFSPDSARLAYAGLRKGSNFIVVDDHVYGNYDALLSGWKTRTDGKPRLHHSERMEMIAFSPDSRRVAYATKQAGKAFAVLLDANERRFIHDTILNQPPLFSPDSQHLAYGVEQYLEQGVTIDGKVLWAYSGLPPTEWAFSPDSRLLAYITWNGKDRSLALSGRETPLQGGVLANSSLVWNGSDHLHFLASDLQRIWVQNVVIEDVG